MKTIKYIVIAYISLFLMGFAQSQTASKTAKILSNVVKVSRYSKAGNLLSRTSYPIKTVYLGRVPGATQGYDREFGEIPFIQIVGARLTFYSTALTCTANDTNGNSYLGQYNIGYDSIPICDYPNSWRYGLTTDYRSINRTKTSYFLVSGNNYSITPPDTNDTFLFEVPDDVDSIRMYNRIVIEGSPQFTLDTVLAGAGTFSLRGKYSHYSFPHLVLNIYWRNKSVFSDYGSPEGVITALPGTIYLNKNGGADSTLWVKESGIGNTGWVPK